ncbi:MAG: hypothetical protein AUJ56_01345 [Zetaproteobacteria bacterium CG1_02_49_23]|nr:MAG: hypothetical protein AUJ56_01345 [Zetaproteobacteria bacterium CG1_02_49_23]
MDSASIILYHKQSTSAMTRFFRLDGGSVLIGHPLAKLSRVVTGEVEPDSSVVPHPGSITAEIERWLGLASGDLEAEPEYHERVEVPGKIVRIYLARFKTIDPPFAEAEAVNGSFVALTQMRSATPVELELLRTAYTMIMEG